MRPCHSGDDWYDQPLYPSPVKPGEPLSLDSHYTAARAAYDRTGVELDVVMHAARKTLAHTLQHDKNITSVDMHLHIGWSVGKTLSHYADPLCQGPLFRAAGLKNDDMYRLRYLGIDPPVSVIAVRFAISPSAASE